MEAKSPIRGKSIGAGRDRARSGWSTDQAVRQFLRRPEHRPDHPARFLLLPARPVRLRQDDDPAHDRRARDADLGRDLHRRPDGGRQAAGRARHGHDVPELCAVPASHRSRQRRLLSEDARRRQRGAPPEGAGDAAARAARSYEGPDAGPAVGRPAAARGAGAFADHQPERAAARRAAVGARRVPAAAGCAAN